MKGKKLLGYDFHRQKPIGHYIVDFYCPKLKLVIEIDGSSHNNKIEYDKRRNKYLKAMGVNVIHFRDIDVKRNLQGVLNYIKEWIAGFCDGEHTPSLTTEKVVQIHQSSPDTALISQEEEHTPSFRKTKIHPSQEEEHTPSFRKTKIHPSQEGEHTPSFRKTKIHPSQEGIYQGVKFKTVFRKREAPNNKNIEDIKYWCRIFHKKNLAPPYPGGSFGNLSFRIRNGENSFIITGSRIGLKNSLTNNSFVEVENCDFKNKIIYANGTREPSSESMLHFAIYKARPDINAIFHGHCAELLENAGKLEIPTTSKEEPYGTIELVNSVLEIIDKNDMVMMKNHGFIALGKTMKETGEITLKYLERTCRK